MMFVPYKKLTTEGHVDGFYNYETEHTVHTYRFEHDSASLKHQQVPKWARTHTYVCVQPEMAKYK